MNILVTSKVISLDRKLSIFVKLFAVHNINWAIDNAQASFADNGFNEWRCGSTSVSLRRDRRCRALPSAHLRCLHLQNRLPPSTHQVQPNRWLFVNSWRRNDAMFILHLAFIIWKSSMDKLSSRERRYYFWTIFSDVIHLQRYRNGIRTENFIQRRLFHFLLINFSRMRKVYRQKTRFMKKWISLQRREAEPAASLGCSSDGAEEGRPCGSLEVQELHPHCLRPAHGLHRERPRSGRNEFGGHLVSNLFLL